MMQFSSEMMFIYKSFHTDFVCFRLHYRIVVDSLFENLQFQVVTVSDMVRHCVVPKMEILKPSELVSLRVKL